MEQDHARGGAVVRAVGRGVLTLLLLVVALGQLVAWTSPTWWVPALQLWPVQYVVLACGVVRDALGVWNVVLAVALLVLVLRGARCRGTGLLRPVPVLAVVVAASSLGLWSYQVVDARQAGADVGAFAPVVPFRQGTVDPDRSVTVGTVDGTDLDADLYLPRDTDDAGGVPVVVYVHGGGFTSGAPAPSPYYPPLLDRGYAVLDVSYRLATPDRQTWDTAVADVGCALTWVTTEGPGVGLDPGRVGTMGDSAGGQLAINAANLGARDELDPSCRTRGELPQVSAVVAGYPAVDGAAAYEESGLGRAYGNHYVGGPPEEFPERYAFTDSVNHLGRGNPPLLVYQGGADHLILPGPVRDFARASREAGTTTRYVELPGQEHTTGGGLGTLSFGDLVGRDLATQWFVEHL
ncbi:S9 family peptidase [Aeromicrobium sp. 50.2.37]|uniref:alpha/beta hydrolase family protein n=1 Tax=Aeromicrobium sp. 50.2.37 TaxID=2969305 RepID=UPI00214F826C|nr:alpha/beta hydrolase [Aeromicrobium sp. 50.2.37]MCR4514468.1 alpha/beta hydrolase [Aeromicrobium sp. 50.2.37]